mmetsp:Transcript_40270/g.56697  ORF Transcript_40270/g.56697 Transcript_40270/m.56697 type:complete len:213 (+) Transcript_40270:852-1490(+)
MMPGFKNVMFGGEGLFVTTLCGPGTVWLQGMPPDRMISEIARRVPAGGIGLGVPVGAPTSTTGSESDLANTENEVASGDLGEVAAATDDAIEADRLGTVASSGFSTIENDVSIDSDSPSALFGDVAPDHSDNFTEDQSFTNTENTSGDIWEDSEGKYTGDSFSNSDFGDEFEDDTTFTTFDGSMDEGTQETSKSFLSTIFDMFTGGDFTGGD